MLSRVANSLYWMARYLERADNLARLLEASQKLILDMPESRMRSSRHYGRAVLRTTGVEESLIDRKGLESWKAAAFFLTLDPGNPDSIRSCIKLARENARVVRDQLSESLWNELNRLHLYLTDLDISSMEQLTQSEMHGEIISRSMLIQGLADNTLARREGWQFLRLGKFLERADQTSRIIEINFLLDAAASGGAVESHYWTSVLQACSARSAHRMEEGGLVSTESVIGLLVFSKVFARSIRFSLGEADNALHAISGVPRGEYGNEPERQMGNLLAELSFSSPALWLEKGLHDSIDRLQTILNTIGQGIFETYVLFPSRLTEVGDAGLSRMQMQHQQQQ